jgi:hypothetical protein
MNAPAEKKSEPLKHTFSLTVDVEPFWIAYLTHYPDIFAGNYVGYWLRGVENLPELGWLCWEDDEKGRLHGHEPNGKEAMRAWRAGEPLPKHWFRLDRAAALRAWEEGVKRWGVDWYEEADATSYDIVLQLALLGEIRYG